MEPGKANNCTRNRDKKITKHLIEYIWRKRQQRKFMESTTKIAGKFLDLDKKAVKA